VQSARPINTALRIDRRARYDKDLDRLPTRKIRESLRHWLITSGG